MGRNIQQIPRHVSQGLRRKSRHWSSRLNSHPEEPGHENDETLGEHPRLKWQIRRQHRHGERMLGEGGSSYCDKTVEKIFDLTMRVLKIFR